MRDQLKNTDKAVFQTNMLPANETPPIAGLAASGIADVPIYLLRATDGNVVAGTEVFIGGSGNGWTDTDGHGTSMAGLIGAHGHGPGNVDGGMEYNDRHMAELQEHLFYL